MDSNVVGCTGGQGLPGPGAAGVPLLHRCCDAVGGRGRLQAVDALQHAKACAAERSCAGLAPAALSSYTMLPFLCCTALSTSSACCCCGMPCSVRWGDALVMLWMGCI